MSHYLLSVIYPEGATRPAPEVLDQMGKELTALKDELRDSGAMVFGGGLYPPAAATVVRATADGIVTTDGPFAETKEQLGGVSIIAVDDLDRALAIASRHASIIGVPIEIRPFEAAG